MATSMPELVGREAELAGFTTRLESLRAGRGGLVLVSGEAGIGKSRLAETVSDLATRAGVSVGFGRCQETEGAPPFWPWMQLLPAVGGKRTEDELLAPLLRSEAVDAAGADRFQVFDAAASMLARVAAAGPLVIVLDDLHRADEASLALLRFVLPVLRRTPVLVLGTYRPTEVPARHPLSVLLGEATADLAFELVELRGLTLAETAELARRMHATVPDVMEVHELTGGNPFYLTEVLRLGPGRGTPPTVELAIRARLGRLPAATRDLLSVAAVLGRDVDAAVLAALAGRDELAVKGELTPAVDAGLVTRRPGGGHRFEHILVQQVLYQGWPEPELTHIHDRAVAAISALGRANDESRLAHHAVRAATVCGGRARAVGLAVRAARNAARRLAHEEAADWFGCAAELGVPDTERIGLLLDLGASATRAGRATAAREAYETAWTLGEHRRDVRVEAALGLGTVVVSAGRVDAGLVRHLEHTAAMLGPDDEADRIRLSARLAVELYWGPELPRARALATDAVTAARSQGDPRALTAALAAAQFVLRGPQAPEPRIRIGRELAEQAQRRGDEEAELLARRMLVPELLQVNAVAADCELEVLADLATSSGRPLAQWYVLVFRAMRATMAGHADAVDLVEQAYQLGRRVQAQPATVYAAGQRFALRSRLPTAHVEADLRRHVARYPVLTVFRCQLAVLLAENSRRDEAGALLDELTADDCAALAPDSLWLANACQLAETAALLDDRRHAAHLHTVLTPYAERIAVQGVPMWNGAVARYLALTATTLGRWDEADARFDEALRLHEAWGAAELADRTLREHAAMLRRRGAPGDRPRAVRLGGRPVSPAPAGTALTTREAEVLDALATGASNKEIAHRLHLSVHTVERHVANIYVKIDARNRAEATAFALRAI